MDSEVYGIMLVPVIVGGIEVLKHMGLPKRFCPLAAVLVGTLIGAVYLSEGDLKKGILKGIYMGLTAVGMYSGTRNVIGKKAA